MKETVPTPADKMAQNPSPGLNPNGNGQWRSQPEELNDNPNYRTLRRNEKPLDPSIWSNPQQAAAEQQLKKK